MEGSNWNEQAMVGGVGADLGGQGRLSGGGGGGGQMAMGGGGQGSVGFGVAGGGGGVGGAHQCQLCGSMFGGKRAMLTHLKECSETQMKVLFEANQCLQCRNAFLSRELLLVHINTCAGEQLEQVIQIETMAAMQAARAAQIKQEHDAAMAKERAEKKASSVKTERVDDDGASSQGDAESFDGDDEGKSRKSSYSSRKSYSSVKNEDDNAYPCPVENCDKAFSSENILKNHNDTVHLGKSNHQCGLCGKKFTTSKSMKMHDEAVHQGKKNYKCNACGKSFSGKSYLKQQMNLFISELDITVINVKRATRRKKL